MTGGTMGWRQCRCVFVALVLSAGLAACGGGSTKTPTKPRTISPPHTVPRATSSGGAALAADNDAKALALTADTTAQAYGTDNNGSFAALTATSLHAMLPAIQIGPGAGNAYIANPVGVAVLDNGAGYAITATSTTGDTFSVGESSTGTSTRTCTGVASTACKSGSW
jgi:hypothetical protein